MRWTPGGVSGDIEDRRSEGGSPIRGSHLGLGGTILLLLLSLIKDIRRNVEILLDAAPVLAKQTANLTKLAATPGVLDLIIEEAIVQDGYMDVLGAHYAAPGEVIA